MIIMAVFRSRPQCLDYAERLKKYGVHAELAAAPKEARIGCGLCVKFEERQFVRAKAVLTTAKYSAFKGFYKTDFSFGYARVIPYYGKRGGF